MPRRAGKYVRFLGELRAEHAVHGVLELHEKHAGVADENVGEVELRVALPRIVDGVFDHLAQCSGEAIRANILEELLRFDLRATLVVHLVVVWDFELHDVDA